MYNGVVIRPATKEDVSDLYKLMKQYIVDFYKQLEPKEDDLKGLIIHLLENPSSGLQFVAEENGELLGFTTLNKTIIIKYY